MKLTVLGGSAAGPNTGQGCSGYLISEQETRLVLDLGPGTLPELRKHTDFRTLDGIIISHVDLDHVLDLLTLRDALAYGPIPAPLPLPLWLPPGGAAILRQAGAAFLVGRSRTDFFSPMFSIIEYDPVATVEVGDLTVSFARTAHSRPCWATRVASRFTPHRDLVYTGDTGPSADLRELATDVSVLVCEATLLAAGEEPFEKRTHLTALEAGALASRIGVETLVLTHMWEESGRDDAVREATRAFAGKIAVAYPGLEVSW